MVPNELLSSQSADAELGRRLGMKLRNQCMRVMDASPVSFIDGIADGQKVTGQHFRPHFRPEDVPQLVSEDFPNFAERLPRAYESMLFSGVPTSLKGSYINGLGGEDFDDLPAIGMEIAAYGGKESGTVMRVIYGGTEQMPLRGLSYLLPALLLMENMNAKGIEIPQLQVIFANSISSTLNHLDLQQATDQAIRFSQVAQAYVAEFFPAQLDSVVFLEDMSIEKGTDTRQELLRVTREVDEYISQATRERLFAKGNNGSGRLNIFYGAAHLLMHDTDLPSVVMPFSMEQPIALSPRSIISIGGHQERDFYTLRHEVKPYLGAEYNTVRTLQYFTRHKVPPYYMARGGDVALDSVLAGSVDGSNPIAKTAAVDLGVLEEMTLARGSISLSDFMTKFKDRRAA